MFKVIYAFVAMLLLCLGAALAGCGTDSATMGSTDSGVTGSVSHGEAIFELRCASCHSAGTDRRYGPGLAGLFSAENDRLLPNGDPISEVSVAHWIRTGGEGELGVMPPQALNDRELADVIAYLRTLDLP